MICAGSARILLRALLLIASVAIAFALAELALMLAYRSSVGPGNWMQAEGIDSPYVHHATPGVGDMNNLAIRRDRDTQPSPAPGVLRVLSYGDSVAHGYALVWNQTYTHLLEEELQTAVSAPVEVLNMHRGHSPTIHAFHLRHDVPMLSPDAVILQIELLNDVTDEAFVRASDPDEFGLPKRLISARYLLGFDGHLLSPSAPGSSFWQRTLLYAKLRRWWGRRLSKLSPNPLFADDADTHFYALREEQYLLTQQALDRGFDRMFESIAGIQRFLAARDVAFLLLIMPSRDAYEPGRQADGARRLIARAEARAAQLGVAFVSPLEPLAGLGGEQLFIDFCHPTAQGHVVIAGLLRDPVAKLLEGSPSQSGAASSDED